MNDAKLIGAVYQAMGKLCWEKGYAAPVDVLMEIGVLPKDKYLDWRHGRVRYLEAVCTCNLSKLSTAMHHIRVYAQKNGLKPSYCAYHTWGKKNKMPLRFSKSGRPEVEKWYATHMVHPARMAELKQQAQAAREAKNGTAPAAENGPAAEPALQEP